MMAGLCGPWNHPIDLGDVIIIIHAQIQWFSQLNSEIPRNCAETIKSLMNSIMLSYYYPLQGVSSV